MSDATTFKCRACDGTGGKGPLRISTGLPFRPCIQCGGSGEIEREVDDVYDKQGHMSALGQTARDVRRPTPAHMKWMKEQEAERFRSDDEERLAFLARKPKP